MKKSKRLYGLFFVVSLSTLIFSGCAHSLFGIKGIGNTITQEVIIENFDKIDMTIDADVVFIKGDVQKVEIEGQQNIIDNIKTKVKSGKWYIEYYKNVSKHEPVTIYITIPEITEIIISGSGDIYSDDTFDTDDLTLKIPGSGNIDLSVNSDDVDLSISGSGNIYLSADSEDVNVSISGSGNICLKGGTIKQDISISGSGDYNCFSFFSKKTDVNISGSGSCEVLVQDDLFVRISGSGNVYYRGDPTINSVISGSGDVIDKN